MYVHQECLMKWLNNKYPASYRSLILMSCELCKYEYKGKVSYLQLSQIIKRIQYYNETYYLLMNIPIIFYLSYRLKYLIFEIFFFIFKELNKIEAKQQVVVKFGKVFFILTKTTLKLFSVIIYSAALRLICSNSLKLFLDIISECKIIKFENFIY